TKKNIEMRGGGGGGGGPRKKKPKQYLSVCLSVALGRNERVIMGVGLYNNTIFVRYAHPILLAHEMLLPLCTSIKNHIHLNIEYSPGFPVNLSMTASHFDQSLFLISTF
ncbi:hypothetical protein ACJX0J_027514, partial [Zea mays]